jgi:hypothetical protein
MHTNRRRVLQAIAAAGAGGLLARFASAAGPLAGPAATGARGPAPTADAPPPAAISYPQSYATSKPIDQMLDAIIANRDKCSRFYLDTKDEHSLGFLGLSGGENHHQGLARTLKLADGSIFFFLTHSVIGGRGQLMQFRLHGPTQGEHPVETSPHTVATLVEELHLDEEHPSDLVFLPDVAAADSGYLFVTEEFQRHLVEVFHWRAGQPLRRMGVLTPFDAKSKDSNDWPVFIAMDRVGDTYYLAVMNKKHLRVYTAPQGKLFPIHEPGRLDLSALVPHAALLPCPNFEGACQVKLIRDSAGAWSLLAFRSHKDDDPNGDDFVDVYPVQFAGPTMSISPRRASRHVFLPHGDTGFASTGTHLVEPSGRMLLSSSYRWAKDEGPGGSSYVSRVDECPS